MPDPNDQPEDEVRRKVIYEHVSTSGTSKQNIIIIVVLLVIALALVGWILMHMHH
jgi:flagellar basal body-associated protein FliL